MDISALDVKIIREDQSHVRGLIIIINKNNPTSKLFLAARVNDNWEIVFDGQQANYSCSLIAKYNFPPVLVKDCAK